MRTLLILVTIACVVLGMSIFPAQRYQAKKRHAEAMVASLGGTVELAGWKDVASPGANWFSLLCGFGEPRETRWKVNLAGKAITPQQVQQLGSCDWIRILDLSNTHLGDAELNNIANISKLRELRLANTQITDAGLKQLKRLERLYLLDASGPSVTYDGLAELEKSFPGSNFREQLALARLEKNQNISHSQKFVEATPDLDVFPPPLLLTASIVNLSEGGKEEISDEDVADLRQLSSATQFDVQGHAFPQGGLAFLADLTNLESVGIYDQKKTIGVRDSDLITLARLPKLKQLGLNANAITNDGMAHLSAAHQLQTLSIHGYQLTPQCLVHLRGLLGLKQLDLNMWNYRAHNEYVEDPTAAEIADAREGVKNLAAIPNLEFLSVMGNLMVDDVVATFADLKQLKSLKLDGRYCSQETVDLIQRALPNCKIERPVYK